MNPTHALVNFAANVSVQNYYVPVVTVTPFYTLADVDAAGERVCREGDGGTMRWTPAETIDVDGKQLNEVTVVYDNCQISGMNFSGTVLFASEGGDARDPKLARYFKYVDLQIDLNNNETITVNGVDSLAFGTSCLANRPMRSYLHVVNESRQEQWLYENMIVSHFSDSYGADCGKFADDAGTGSVYSGRIAHATHGVVVIPQTAIGAQTSPYFEITGATDNRIRYELNSLLAPLEISTDYYDISGTPPVANVRFGNESVDVLNTTHLRSDIRKGSLSTFQDTDADSRLDSWEGIYAMDPLDTTDAMTDADGDLLSAVQEFAFGSDPTNNADMGWINDSKIIATSSYGSTQTPSDGYTSHQLHVSVPTETGRVRANKYSYSLTLTGDATFESANPSAINDAFLQDAGSEQGGIECSFTDLDKQAILCNAKTDTHCIFYFDRDYSNTVCTTNMLFPSTFTALSSAGTPFNISVELQAGPQELNLENNRISLAIGY